MPLHPAINWFSTVLTRGHSTGDDTLQIRSDYREDFDPSEDEPAYLMVFQAGAIDDYGRILNTDAVCLFEVTDRVGGVLTAEPVDGYTDQSFVAGSKVIGAITAEHINELQEAINEGGGGGGLPSQTGHNGHFLTTNGTAASWSAIAQANVTNLAADLATMVTATSTVASNLSTHTSNTSNPHSTTAAQVGAYTTGQTDTLLAGKSSTGHTHTLDDLSDAAVTSPAEGHVIRYDGVTWVNDFLQTDDLPDHSHAIADVLLLQATLDAKSPLAGSASIVTVGTVTTGVWNGTAIASAYIGTHSHAAADITSGTIATARLGSGTANSTTFLRGDQTWATPSAAISIGVAVTSGTANYVLYIDGSSNLAQNSGFQYNGSSVTVYNSVDTNAAVIGRAKNAAGNSYAFSGLNGSGTENFKVRDDGLVYVAGVTLIGSTTITFGTTSNEGVRVDSSGRVGIGTVSPPSGYQSTVQPTANTRSAFVARAHSSGVAELVRSETSAAVRLNSWGTGGTRWKAATKTTASGNITLTMSTAATTSAYWQAVDPNGSDRDITLPSVSASDIGLSYKVTHIGGANTLTIKNSGGTTITTVASGTTKEVTYDGANWQVTQ